MIVFYWGILQAGLGLNPSLWSASNFVSNRLSVNNIEFQRCTAGMKPNELPAVVFDQVPQAGQSVIATCEFCSTYRKDLYGSWLHIYMATI